MNEQTICKDCGGSGERGRNPAGNGDPQCVETDTCDTCHGDGVLPTRWAGGLGDWRPERAVAGGPSLLICPPPALGDDVPF